MYVIRIFVIFAALTSYGFSAHAGLLRKLLVTGAVVGVGVVVTKSAKNDNINESFVSKPIPDPAAYSAEQQRRHLEIIGNSPSNIDIEAIPENVKYVQCAAAATYALVGRNASSYRAYVDQLQENGYLKSTGAEKGINLESIRHLLKQAGYPNDFFPVDGKNIALVERIAEALDEGKAVFLSVDAVVSHRLLTGKDPSASFSQRYFGTRHLVRVTAVARDDQGRAENFGIFDVTTRNPPFTNLTSAGLLELLSTATLKTAFRRGALITQEPVYSAVGP
jgi:hypothetical protein